MSDSLGQFATADRSLDIVHLQSPFVRVAIVPAAAGKIIELIDRRSGRNWLWSNPDLPVARAARDATYESELDSGGWDEVLLSVKPALIQVSAERLVSIPDHGDLLSCEWQLSDLQLAANQDATCTMAANGIAANYRFERRLRLPQDEAAIDINYKLRNDGDAPLPWFWCAHPLFAIEPDARIEIDGRPLLRVEDVATRELCGPNSQQRWPELLLKNGSRVDLSQSFADDGTQLATATKLFVQNSGAGCASVVQGGARLNLIFDAAVLPWLGLWINSGAWSGCGSEPYFNLGMEPATTPYDCVNEAAENNALLWLQPGEERQWSLRVELQEQA